MWLTFCDSKLHVVATCNIILSPVGLCAPVRFPMHVLGVVMATCSTYTCVLILADCFLGGAGGCGLLVFMSWVPVPWYARVGLCLMG